MARWVARGQARYRANAAVIGAVATRPWGEHATWLPAGFVIVSLGLFIVDQRAVR